MPGVQETTPPPHVHTETGDENAGESTPKTTGTPRSASGWDGKLRVEKNLALANPEALSDPDYSDEENVVPGETIDADEGRHSSPDTISDILMIPSLRQTF